jgi:hypothetical protein
MQRGKQPRDFVHVDEFWEADEHWPRYYIGNKVWVFADEYRAELAGDEDYSRIIIHSNHDTGWLFSRRLKDKSTVEQALQAIQLPVSEQQLEAIGFTRWTDFYI